MQRSIDNSFLEHSISVTEALESIVDVLLTGMVKAK